MLQRTRIKVCGMTRERDVHAAVAAGVDAIGFILHADSPRTIELDHAVRLRKLIPAFINVVGVFVDASDTLIERYSATIGLDLIQLHGDESPTFAAKLSRPYIKALRVKSPAQVLDASQEFVGARGLLLDPYVKGQHGGTGRLLDAQQWPTQNLDHRLILAGGLNAENIKQRVLDLAPFAVDINSGIETQAGYKCSKLLNNVVRAVRSADMQRNTEAIAQSDEGPE